MSVGQHGVAVSTPCCAPSLNSHGPALVQSVAPAPSVAPFTGAMAHLATALFSIKYKRQRLTLHAFRHNPPGCIQKAHCAHATDSCALCAHCVCVYGTGTRATTTIPSGRSSTSPTSPQTVQLSRESRTTPTASTALSSSTSTCHGIDVLSFHPSAPTGQFATPTSPPSRSRATLRPG
jgi:hypothetical protein